MSLRDLILSAAGSTGEEPAPPGGTWTKLADMPFSLQQHTMVTVGNFLYVFGGVGSSSLLRYNPSNNTWLTLSTGATGGTRNQHSAAGFSGGGSGGDLMHIFGGQRSGGGTFLADTWTYNAFSSAWTQRANNDGFRLTAASPLDTSRVLVTGGIQGTVGSARNQAQIFNRSTNTWAFTSAMPRKLYGHVQTTDSNGDVWVYGGSRETTALSPYLIKYIPGTAWGEFAQKLPGRNYSAFGAIGNYLYCFGGDSTPLLTTSDAFIRYSILDNTWENLILDGDFPTLRSFVGSCVFAGSLYISGGTTGANELWRFTPNI